HHRDPGGAHAARCGRRGDPRAALDRRRRDARPARALGHSAAGHAAGRQADGRGNGAPVRELLPVVAHGGRGARPGGARGEARRLCDRVAIMDHGKIIALDAPGALIASLGAEHVVEFALADGAAPGADELAALPGVRAVRPAPDRTALTVAEVHRAVPALLALLERRGAELSLLATHHATLEDVFVTLTGRQLRDA